MAFCQMPSTQQTRPTFVNSGGKKLNTKFITSFGDERKSFKMLQDRQEQM